METKRDKMIKYASVLACYGYMTRENRFKFFFPTTAPSSLSPKNPWPYGGLEQAGYGRWFVTQPDCDIQCPALKESLFIEVLWITFIMQIKTSDKGNFYFTI